MEGFGGSTGVSNGYVDRAIAQSTAISAYTEANITNTHANVTLQTTRIRVTGGGLCFASIAFKTTGAVSGYSTLFTLPVGCRPVGESNINITGLNQKSYPCTINTNGNVLCRSGVDAQDWLQGSVSFPV